MLCSNDSVRKSYIADVRTIAPFDRQEASELNATVQWLSSSISVNKPDNMEKHLGVLAAIISDDHAFLINHRKSGLWLPPGGHVDPGITLRDAVEQECVEELATSIPFIDSNPIFINEVSTVGQNAGHVDVTLWFGMKGDIRNTFTIFEKEATEGRWFPMDVILSDVRFRHIQRAFSKIAALLTTL